MKIIYTTDLHGDTNKYRQLEKVAFDFEADVVINGGDLLPHGNWGDQVKFITHELDNHFEYFENLGIDYIIQMGNDDMSCLDHFFRTHCWSYDHVYDIAQRRESIDDFDFIGLNLVLDYPFRLKDRCRFDNSDDNISPNQYGTALQSVSNKNNYEEIPDWEQCIHERLTLAEELALLPQPRPDSELIYIFHQPPAGVKLDVCYDLRTVGSQAVTEFLTNSTALYSLHGHIHENFKITGIWKVKIGNTIAVQPGQLENFTYVTIDTETGISERFEI